MPEIWSWLLHKLSKAMNFSREKYEYEFNSMESNVVFVILSPSAIVANHNSLNCMQSIPQPIAFMSVAAW